MKEYVTYDGSVTWFSEFYQQDYHSHAGAFLEASKLYVAGCDLLRKAKEKKQISILDVGFGLGYNAFAPILQIHEVNPSCKVKVVSFEMDPEVFLFDKYPDQLKALSKKIKSNWKQTGDVLYYEDETTELVVYMGDARQKIQALPTMQFDAVFQDAFSPPRNPELWTVEFFTHLRKRLKNCGRLVSYSIATPVLNAMREAGLHPFLAPGSGTKLHSIIATKVKTQALSEKFTRKLKTSPEKEPFRDPEMTWPVSRILEERNKRRGLQ